MTALVVKRQFPFTQWNADRGTGDVSKGTHGTLKIHSVTDAEYGYFTCEFTWRDRVSKHASIDDALKEFNDEIKSYARLCGWTPESEVAHA